ncbi:MAG: hypothetical protein ABIH20_02025 [Candidatus Diapherotrites archaeon]
MGVPRKSKYKRPSYGELNRGFRFRITEDHDERLTRILVDYAKESVASKRKKILTEGHKEKQFIGRLIASWRESGELSFNQQLLAERIIKLTKKRTTYENLVEISRLTCGLSVE